MAYTSMGSHAASEDEGYARPSRYLTADGHERRTSPALAILPTLYLALRGSRRFDETGRGMTPFWVGLVIVIVTVFLLIWGPDGVLALLL